MYRNELKVGMITKRSQQIKSFSPSNFKERVFVLTGEKIQYFEGSVEVGNKFLKFYSFYYICTILIYIYLYLNIYFN